MVDGGVFHSICFRLPPRCPLCLQLQADPHLLSTLLEALDNCLKHPSLSTAHANTLALSALFKTPSKWGNPRMSMRGQGKAANPWNRGGLGFPFRHDWET
ncbi:hypothetical protein INT44_001588 [Umbelopsis vinacea]|uniref:Uncharacterized protein n=1 Tax=Umbelopsis vinacea TaxID=44442 RepID=A0A8H7PQV9_9FUNG|nr:hypothetical protein INT44_001588 [Umbelopsis vinacea]